MQSNLTKTDIKNKIENLEKYFSKYKNQSASKKLEEIKQKPQFETLQEASKYLDALQEEITEKQNEN